MAALEAGGNAVDAAVATALTLGVVDGHNSGIGGGCFILVRAADGTVTCIDGREMAPAAAHRDMYVKDGVVDEEGSKTGPRAPAVPGALAAYALALKKHGKLSMKDLLLPAAQLAEKGFPLDEVWARKLAGVAEMVKRYPASAAVLLHEDGSPRKKGEQQVQRDLAATYRLLAEKGFAEFYRGSFAKTCAEWMRNQGGLLTDADFAAYLPLEREPLRTSYRGYELIGMPPPSSGGVHVAQVLQMVERFDLKALPVVQRLHVLGEAMKLAFADRAHWLGDPDYAAVPRGLISRSYTDGLSQKINLTAAQSVETYGTPERAHDELFGKHTTHLCAADAVGNWVSLTQTINTAFGSKVIIPGTGVLLNNEMDDFSIQPGVPNAFKLVGAEANAVAAKKRPLSSMSPTIVLKNGQPVGCVGAAGGPTIITQVIQALVQKLDLGASASEALAGPRIHHQWKPDELRVEVAVGTETLAGLKAMGHPVTETERMGAAQLIWKEGSALVPVHDPRVPGEALVK